MQQLSVPLPPGPQFVIPAPPGAQLGGCVASAEPEDDPLEELKDDPLLEPEPDEDPDDDARVEPLLDPELLPPDDPLHATPWNPPKESAATKERTRLAESITTPDNLKAQGSMRPQVLNSQRARSLS